MPPEWVFQDEGYSGAILVRPGLGSAARSGGPGADRRGTGLFAGPAESKVCLSGFLLSEELSRCGVELIFLKAPAGATPEDQLLVQFQGMIAEYELPRRSPNDAGAARKHMAQQGGVNVLSGAPYGYQYVKKSDASAAFYEVIEPEAKVVRTVFEIYTQQGLSINAIARLLNERQIATRTGKGRWERSTVWGMLRNPAYQGTACYGKTELRPRQRVTRPLRQRKALPSRDVGGRRASGPARTGPRGLGAGAGERRNVRAGARAVGAEQTSFASTYRRADLAARHAGLRTVRLRIPCLHPYIKAKS